MRRSSNGGIPGRLVEPGPLTPSGLPWPIGTSTTVQWITDGTVADGTIATAIPPLFPAYATIVEPDDDSPIDIRDQERAIVDRLAEHGSTQWWLGYLDTGVHDVVFADAGRVLMYWEWPYVLVQAGPDQALDWRGMMPDLIFPLDRSWLFSMLWDDEWTCVGGPTNLIDSLAGDPVINARPVRLRADPTPPSHVF